MRFSPIASRLSLSLVTFVFVACNQNTPTNNATGTTTQTTQQTDFRVYVQQGNQLVQNSVVFDRDIKDFTYACLRDMYYWNDKVPTTIVPSSFASPEAILTACQVKPEDHTSYLVKDGTAFLKALSTGESTSYGLSVKFAAADDLRIAMVQNSSPAAAAGLRRGMKILKVNNGSIRAFEGVASFGTTNFPSLGLDIQDSAGNVIKKDLTPATFNGKTVLKSFVSDVAGKKVGYLLFTSFTQSAIDELETVFATFKSQNVTELVLDLRYNGGGSVVTSQRLASLLATQLSGTVFVRQAHNTRYSGLNSELAIESRQNALALQRLFVIMTANTASASELIINGLKPHIQVLTIGSTSYGKNTGFYPIQHTKSDYVVAIVNTLSQNSLGDGNYSNGFTPTRAEEDDVTSDFGDPKEKCYAAAISYITKGAFPVVTAKHAAEITSSQQYRLIRDTDVWDKAPMILPLPKGWLR